MDRFTDRRNTFMEVVGGGLAIVPAAAETVRNSDVSHPFRQDSDFFFLTGFPEPEAIALFDPNHDSERYVLFVRPRDPERESWDGKRAGVAGAVETYGADAAYPISDLEKVLRDRLRGKRTLYYRLGAATDSRVLGALEASRNYQVRTGVPAPCRVENVTRVLAELRLIKTPDEIAAMREACLISAAGHAEAMRVAQPGMTELRVQAAMEYVFRAAGAEREGYPSIVASGPNAVILHYTENDRTIEAGDLLLIDAAAEFGSMSSDITRTFPVDGRFTAAQREIYDLVLTTQEAVIAVCAPDIPFTDLHDLAIQVLTEGMVELGLLPGPVEDAVAYGWYREFYFHGTGHWLGLDVHDAGEYRVDGAGRLLEPGMVFTVEPGIYIAPDKTTLSLAKLPFDAEADRDLAYLEGAAAAKQQLDERRAAAEKVTHDVPERFLGIGVRIEDDLLITTDGNENLTRGVPVDPDEIEALCAEPPR
ncbi:MAG: aminopeptidase P N-terminal domain-containing protein [Actinomycetota bacterium]|nr:aminopeptidase P N-terminal domain-containing protein [Actinomycetota bacterium]